MPGRFPPALAAPVALPPEPADRHPRPRRPARRTSPAPSTFLSRYRRSGRGLARPQSTIGAMPFVKSVAVLSLLVAAALYFVDGARQRYGILRLRPQDVRLGH